LKVERLGCIRYEMLQGSVVIDFSWRFSLVCACSSDRALTPRLNLMHFENSSPCSNRNGRGHH
jgi:hypothetical protein